MIISKTNYLKFIGLFTAVIGIVVIIGWYFDVTAVKSVLPGYESMKVNTAISFILSGIILFLLVIDKWQPVVRLLCLFIIGMALASLSQRIFKYNLGIDQFLIPEDETTAAFPGRPAVATSFCFILLSLAYLSIKSRKISLQIFSQYCLHAVTLIVFVALVGYLYMIPTLYKMTFITSIAMHTAFLFFILSISATLINNELGITGLFTGKKTGNTISRLLFPQMIVVFLVLGYIRLIAHRYHLISVEFGIALHVITSIIIVLFLVWRNAAGLNLIDDQKKRGENEILRINRNLETTIKELTHIREKLDNKVKELVNTNKELETFNFISSHHLQEPLRKIRTFVSVLLEEEERNLSANGKRYLMRMSDTSKKMQKLIEDLLAYARIRKSPQIFEKTDLNEIVENVVSELKEIIEEKNVEIKTSGLCSANVIPFQFHQLVSNLVSNSIKFADQSRRLQIIINCKIEQGINLNTNLSRGVNYCHITIADNGIGFDPKYNERVFEIFERLHGSDKYPGTGIGLAICKKIAENHGGLITATGELNQGARFDIYIPLAKNHHKSSIVVPETGEQWKAVLP